MIGKIIKIILLFCNGFVALFLFATLFTGTINPKTLPFTSTWAILFPYLLLANFFFLLMWLLGKRKYFLISLVVMLLSIPALKKTYPIFPYSNKLTGTEVDTVKFLSYNTMSNFGYKKYSPNEEESGIQYLLNQDADIMALQEFNVNKNNQYLTEEDVLDIYKKYKYNYIWLGSSSQTKKRKSGMAIFSKYPIVKKELIDYDSNYTGVIYTDIDINGTIYRLFNVHLESNRITAADNVLLRRVRDNFDSDNLSEVTQVLTQKLSEASVKRARQAEIIAKVIKESPHKVIVCGDFNDVPNSYAHSQMLGDNLRDAFIGAGKGLGLTYSNGLYQFRIDYILYDKTIGVKDFVIDKVDYSDHYPIHCSLILPKENK